MRYVALACDYDGTLALGGRVDEPTLAALQRVRDSGRRLLLVTGRRLDDLQSAFPHWRLFDRIVAENGAVAHDPAERETRRLAEPPPAAFAAALRERGVAPFDAGEVIVATWRPNEVAVLGAIRDLGLELQVIFNKDAVMVLPPGVNKATGLAAVLAEMRLSPHNVVAVGDAENDHALLQLCECGVAVANALPMLKERADLVTGSEHGAGVAELIDRLIANDLDELASSLRRHEILLGREADGAEVCLPPYGHSVLLAGTSGGGKSTLAGAFLERLGDRGYQFCLVDPEGDFEQFEGAVVLGAGRKAPEAAEVLAVLDAPSQNAVVNLTGVPRDERPRFFEGLLPRLQELRSATGRPHWIVLDEAHHLLPGDRRTSGAVVPQRLRNTLLITLEPSSVAREALQSIDTLLVLGEDAATALADFVSVAGDGPGPDVPALERGQAALWPRGAPAVRPFSVEPPRAAHRRHRRKYAEGELIEDEHFAFRGPEGKLNLRAENLRSFVRIAEGVDEDTWLYHFRQGDYSRWFRQVIKDEELAREAEGVERENVAAPEGRARIRQLVETRYSV